MQVGVGALMGGTFNWLAGKVAGQPKLPNNSSHPNTANTNKAGTVRQGVVEPGELEQVPSTGNDCWSWTYNIDADVDPNLLREAVNGQVVKSGDIFFTINIPEGSPAMLSDNGGGYIYNISTSHSKITSIRIMGATPYAPNGYAVFYNNNQPINPVNGKTLGKDLWHFLFP